MPKSLISSPQPDYGNLQINFLEEGHTRIIHPNPNDLHGHVWSKDEYEDESWDEYYSFDDDYQRGLPFEETHKKCRRVAFHRNYFPTCNVFHEIEIMKGTNRYLGSGAYREAYLQHETYDPQLVVKVQRFRKNPFTYDRYEFIRMDALVMERLTASPRIADIYGHCATSVYSEFLPDEAEERIIPGDGDGSDLHDEEDVDPKNNFTISEKLDIALQMAESIADLHGYKYGVIVHDDIQLAQFLFAPDGRLKLNDFNRAEAMLFDEKDGSYCRYQNGKGAGDYRAPEEYKDGWLNEKIDIWSFGNNIYALITGLWVFYDEEDTKVKQKKLVNGEIAYLDPRYKGRNYMLDRLIDLMYRCWIYEPDDRVDIFEAVSFLRDTLKEAKRRGIYNGRF
jgi:serine/threonine protein kinase